MKIKGSDTFFPTKFRPTTANTNPDRNGIQSSNSRSYKLMKKRSQTQQSSVNQNKQYESTNIFKNTYYSASDFNIERDKPVGGIQTFMKQHNKKNKGISTRKLSNKGYSPQNKKKQNQNQVKKSCFAIKNQWMSEPSHQVEPVFRQQVFKSHHPYKPPVTVLKKTKYLNQNKGTAKSSGKIQRNTHHANWVTKQTQQFQTKIGVLNQIYYKKPLVQRYGDRYFQFFLRNRYEQDFPPPCYIHQIKSDQQAKCANQDKFISKLKKINPNVRNFQKLIVKGRNLETAKLNQFSENS